MSKATVTFEDEGDQVKVWIDYGEEGGNELSPAHRLANLSVQMAMQTAGTPGEDEMG